MSMGKVPMKAGGSAKQDASVKQGMQVSTATQRAATTTRHRHTEKLSGDTNLYPCHAQPKGIEGEGQIAMQMYNLVLEICTTSQSEFVSSKA